LNRIWTIAGVFGEKYMATRIETAEQRRANYEAQILSLRSVRYIQKDDSVELFLSSGIRVAVPRKDIPPLARAPKGQLADIYPGNGGATISHDALDVDIFVPGLLDRVFGRTVRANLGRRAGKVRSIAKSRAARKNGRKGGRPSAKR